MDYCITVRAPVGDRYGAMPGDTAFLAVPDADDDFAVSQALGSADWVKAVLAQPGSQADATGLIRRDLLVIIHGYSNTPAFVLQRQRRLRADLASCGYDGGVVSFDWPSGNLALAYLDDREKAKRTAFALVRDCIALFARTQASTDCDVNLHLLAHSTGAYVVREAFDDADDRRVLSSLNWTVSQIALIAADISAASMAEGNPQCESLYRHCIRLTNYSSPFDEVLQLANVKRAGLASRAGRVGLPSNAPATAVNVECGEYYQLMMREGGPAVAVGVPSHSWFIGDAVFTADLAYTLNGDLDRRAIPTREGLPSGQFKLVQPGGVVASAAATPVPVIGR